MSQLVSVCSWCIEAGTVVAPPGEQVSHGICDRHAAEVRIHMVKRRLLSTEYLSADTRIQMAGCLEDVRAWMKGTT
jgi:hypothetical protein